MADPALMPAARSADDAPIRLLIVDDSIVARTVLARMLGAVRGFDVTGVVPGVAEAFALLDGGLAVDVILLDLEMPGTDGLTALPALIARSGGARVLIVSSTTAAGAAATVRALTLGAADTLLKPAAVDFNARFAAMLAERLRRIGRVDRPRRGQAAPVAPRRRPAPLRCLAIGASTGGPHALAAFFAALDARIGAPILVTQHMPAAFIPFFAAQLSDLAGRPARVATDGARLIDDAILLAPGDAHLGLVTTAHGVHVRLNRTPSGSGCLPSVDPMFAAVAATFGTGAVAIVLSGMGRDGAAGAAALVAAGGEVMAQDAATSVVWGMPRAAAQAAPGAVVAPPAALARHLSGSAQPR